MRNSSLLLVALVGMVCTSLAQAQAAETPRAAAYFPGAATPRSDVYIVAAATPRGAEAPKKDESGFTKKEREDKFKEALNKHKEALKNLEGIKTGEFRYVDRKKHERAMCSSMHRQKDAYIAPPHYGTISPEDQEHLDEYPPDNFANEGM